MNNTTDTQDEALDINEVVKVRQAKLAELREAGQAYPNDFRRSVLANELHEKYESLASDDLVEKAIYVKVAGRIMLRRLMGKASFVTIQDMSGRIQAYLRSNDLPEGQYHAFKSWDIGDIVAIEGTLFKTKTGELTVKAATVRLLTKSLRPLPDKYHGLTDQEMRYRQRYLDLIVNPESRRNFEIRSQTIEFIRQFLKDRAYMEVETPMMQPIPGGAAARPFITHHNALNIPLYLRIAPELYLKRLVVGGFERVFEINRNFRNEGLSTQHNPEFTMLEFYQAYADYEDLMDLTEVMLRELCRTLLGQTHLEYQGHAIDFEQPFQRLSLKDAILKYNPELNENDLASLESGTHIAEKHSVKVESSHGLGKVLTGIFEETVEHQLIQPTFITQFPTEVSPLSRCNDDDPFVTDRFELFIVGREIANGFSELNDPEDQAKRFKAQVAQKDAGDDEAMFYDADYVTALEHGLPPTAGEGIGIDRLVMLLTNAASIRDILLFPLMKPVQDAGHE